MGAFGSKVSGITVVLNYVLDFILKDIHFHFDIILLMGTKQCPPSALQSNKIQYKPFSVNICAQLHY